MKPLRRAWSRLLGLFRRRHEEQRLREEFDLHLDLLTDEYIRSGLPPTEARRRARLDFGPVESLKDTYREQRSLPRLEALAADAVFAWRQLCRNRTATLAAVLSLALATGAAGAAFRLVEAVLLRTLPVADPSNLYFIAISFTDRDGREDYRDDFDYPTFLRYREAAGDRAGLMVIGMNSRREQAFFDGAAEPENVYRQFVSGNVFPLLGLTPALGRLIQPADDIKPAGHPVAVISHAFWTRRFQRNPQAIGTTFRLKGVAYEIIGVAPEGFTGTEPGEMTDVFLPSMMNAEALDKPGWSWFLTWVRPSPGHTAVEIREILQGVFLEDQRERIKTLHSSTPRHIAEQMLRQQVMLLPASTGVSQLKKTYRRPLLILSALAALLLLVACANVANLLTAQGMARAKEMALRAAIGAGRGRLLQLVLVESAMLAVLAAALGSLFAAWAAPFVTSMLRVPGDPVRIAFSTGPKEAAFSLAMAVAVTAISGLLPALRASAFEPADALHGRMQLRTHLAPVNRLLAAQVAFCVLVLFVAGLFLGTFRQLSTKPLGFEPGQLITVDAGSPSGPLPASAWKALAVHLSSIPGIESAAVAGWPLLSGNRWTGTLRIPGRPLEERGPYLLDVSPGFFATSRISFLAGRDFRDGDTQPRLGPDNRPVAGVAVVNEAFVRAYLDGRNPIGWSVELFKSKDVTVPMEIIGVVRDAVYGDLREPLRPTAYLPMERRGMATLLVRTLGPEEPLLSTVRKAAQQANPSLRIAVQPQSAFLLWRTIQERLLATLSSFFATVALALVALGLYGVLSYAVIRRRREIGIRMALGANLLRVLREVTAKVALSAALGAAAGLFTGIAASRYLEALLYGVKPTSAAMALLPVLALLLVGFLAALQPALRAARIDPARTLRME